MPKTYAAQETQLSGLQSRCHLYFNLWTHSSLLVINAGPLFGASRGLGYDTGSESIVTLRLGNASHAYRKSSSTLLPSLRLCGMGSLVCLELAVDSL
jgi:hypothetical protein